MVLRQNGTPNSSAARAAWISPFGYTAPVRPAGAERDRHRHRLADHRGCLRARGDIGHDALAQFQRVEVGPVRPPGQLIVGSGLDVLEEGPRHPPFGDLPQVLDGGDRVPGRHAPPSRRSRPSGSPARRRVADAMGGFLR